MFVHNSKICNYCLYDTHNNDKTFCDLQILQNYVNYAGCCYNLNGENAG